MALFRSMSRRMAVWLLAVVALLLSVTLQGYAGDVLPFSRLALDGPTCADTNGNVTAIVDSSAHRVLVLDEQDKLTRVISMQAAESPVSAVTDVCISDGKVFVLGFTYSEDSDVIRNERIACYGLHRSPGTVVFELADNYATVPLIKSIGPADDGVTATVMNQKSAGGQTVSKIDAVRIGVDREDATLASRPAYPMLFAAACTSDGQTFVTLSSRGIIEDDMFDDTVAQKSGQSFTSVDMSEEGLIYAVENLTGFIYRFRAGEASQLVIGDEDYERANVNAQRLAAVDTEGNLVTIADVNGGNARTIRGVELSPLLMTAAVLLWLSRIYLVVIVLSVVIRQVSAAFKENNLGRFSGLLTALAVVVAVVLSIGYAAYGAYRASVAERAKEVGMLADVIETRTMQMGEGLEKIKNRDTLRATDDNASQGFDGLLAVTAEIEMVQLAAAGNDINTYYVLYARDDQGVYRLYDGSMEHIMGSSVILPSSREIVEHIFETNEDKYDLYQSNTLRDTTQARFVRIPTSAETEAVEKALAVWDDGDEFDDGDVSARGTAGVIEVGTRLSSFEASLMTSLARNIITLLVLLFVVFIVYSELVGCGRCLMVYLRLRDARSGDAIAALTRPYTFLITTLTSVDAVMSTLIGRSLLEGMGLSAQGFLLALPALMQGVGYMIGQGNYGALGSRMNVRRLIILFAVLIVVGGAFAVVVVGVGSFWLYCAAKLVLGIPFGLLYTLGYSLPRQAKSDEVRALGSGGVRRTDTSAAAFGTILGGFTAQQLGNAWVYVLVAVGGLVVVAMALELLSKDMRPIEDEEVSGNRALAIRHYLMNHSTIVLVLCLMLPIILAGGYNSFLFPLYTAELGIGAGAISNMFVLGQLVVYVSIDAIDVVDVRFGRWHVGVGAVGLLAAVFLLFSMNTSLAWAVAVIALVGVFCKAGDAWKALWMRGAEADGLPAGTATGAMFAMRSVLQVVQPVLLGALLSASRSVAAILLGVVCLVCALLFAWLTRDSALQD